MLAVDYMGHRGTSPQQKYSRPPSTASDTRRTRTVRLVRSAPNSTIRPPPLGCRHGPGLGFSVRGGREHGTGFFVSHIEMGSEAHAQGLRVGDQIVRINGFTLDDAVHKEVLQLISNQTHITLKVRSVGMIPVKDKKSDALSWQIISDGNNSSRSSPQMDKLQDVRINIMVAPRSKLGCGICKGPEWKPGIFVQFTKEGGIAREAGLRPGDQILYCNNVDFSDINFNEAVNFMKTSRQLDLIIRKAAGSELFPGESSGYNSSASSVTGDQSPSWSDSKRLSIVKEENLDLEDRLTHLDRYKLNVKKWETIEWEEEPEEKPYFKSTIKINGPESQANVEQTIPNQPNNKLADICLVSQQHETKTVMVEVHRSDIEQKKNQTNELAKSPSSSSFGSLASKSSGASVTSSSLCSAITQEIQRRTQLKTTKTEEDKPSIDEQLQIKKIMKGVSSDQQFQHTKLMDEFKRAHKKMFKAPPGNSEESNNSPGRPVTSTPIKEAQDRLANQELSQKLAERLSNLQTEEPSNLTPLKKQNSLGTPPPPPPPPPLQNGHTTPPAACSTPSTRSNTLKSKPKAPPVPVKYSVLSYNQPPPCPTPDYDTLSIASTTSSTRPNHLNDSVEIESLDSYKINNPAGVKPKPPNTYFQKSPLSSQISNGSDASGTIRKRPVSVTISEYPSATIRKQPGRLNFLQNGTDETDEKKRHSITSQFANELTQTLNRSNLRKRTESMENLLDSQIKSNKNGSVRISLNSSLCKNLAKSTSDLTEDYSENYSSRVTINVNQKNDAPSGILKNSNFFSQNGHKSLVQQKSITFGDTPIVIKDRHIT